jgi:exosortase/archaeosortase family protein
MLRFTLVTGAWFVGLFGLMRLPWVERTLLEPFAQLQQGVADQLTGAPSDLVYADASCSGGDPMALCAGAILAFPATWGARLRGAAVGLTAITALNVVRLGNLSLVAEDGALLDLLHVYVWPGILILAAAGFVYAWMGRQGEAADGGPGGGAAAGALPGGAALGPAARRFLLLAALLVVAYFATAPFFYQSPAVDLIAGWIAVAGGTILSAAGTTAIVQGALIYTSHGAFIVTQECIFTPLIPLYLAGALAAPLGWKRRTAMLLATPAVFFALGVSRLLVLAVPAAVVGSYVTAIHAFSQTLVAVLLVAAAAFWTVGAARRGAARGCLAIGAGAVAAFAAAPVLGASVGGAAAGLQALAGHAGHAFADDQGAWAILPAFQVGLFIALWIAVAGGRSSSWRRALAGLGGVVLMQALFGLPVDELAHHYGFDPHVGLLRGWALALPAAAVWRLTRPAPFTVLDAPARRALPQAG